MKWLSALVILILALTGCNQSTQRDHLNTQIVDPQGKPIPNAKIHVWAYALDAKDAQSQAADLGKRLEDGGTLMGWHFNTNSRGIADCTGFYESGREVEVPPYSVTTRKVGENPSEGTRVYRYGDHWQIVYPDGTVVDMEPTRKSKDRREDPKPEYKFVPREDHWWLAVTVEATGYEPRHFAFNPESPDPSLKLITLNPSTNQLIKAIPDYKKDVPEWFGNYSLANSSPTEVRARQHGSGRAYIIN